jgi:hypothetical protein
MGRQQIKQAARKTALQGQERRRRERAAQDKRLEGLAVDVLVAVAERDEAVREAEQRAGVAVRSMQGQGLSAVDVAQCCGARVGVREVRRLAQVTAQEAGDGPGGETATASEAGREVARDGTGQERQAG